MSAFGIESEAKDILMRIDEGKGGVFPILDDF